jgi:siroheme synthase-like protein
MALFPFFINLESARGLIVGTGRHAQEKIEKLEPYGPSLTVISEDEFEENILERGFRFVIVAGENVDQNHEISEICRRHGILVNVVDDPEYCDFIFPSLISRGNLSVGISTNGASPAAGVLLKRKMEAQIPDNIEEILDFLQEKRPVISQAFKNKKQRFQFYYQISELCMSLNRPLTDLEFKELLEKP